ncbi:MAG: hypothetical protein MUP58_02530 [Candidatus Nanohaloarchaeota archaeon QJJ-9]|nr:hypothetical protein [Candidatus Nanohaloarchaeota archaeon QJJ-9]
MKYLGDLVNDMYRRYLLLLLALAAITAGCLDSSNGGVERKAIEIRGPRCTVAGSPCGDYPITKYDDDTTITVDVSNYGESPVTVESDKIMVSKCNDKIIGVDEPNTEKYDNSTGAKRTVSGSVELEKGDQLTVEWNLEIFPNGGDVSSLGNSCPMDFQMQFSQDLVTSKQVQIKEEEASRVSLEEYTSSKEPVKLVVESPDVFVPDSSQEKPFTARAYLKNVGQGEVEKIHSLSPSGDVFDGDDCTVRGTELRMYGGGEREGESYRKVCNNVLKTPKSGSEVRNLKFESSYTYTQDLGEVNLKIVPQ